MRIKFASFAWIAALVLAAAGSARADVITFEAQGTSAPGWYTGALNSPLSITTASDTASFSGGQLLNGEVFGMLADPTVVYATGNGPLIPSGYSDPITITFASAVNGVSLDVTNELSFNHTYIVTDNFGNSQSQQIVLNSTQLFTLADKGITSVTISSLPTTSNWAFAIDNVTFNGSSAGVPEPSTLTMLLISLGGIAAVVARKRRTA